MSRLTGSSFPGKKSGVIESASDLTRGQLMILIGIGATIVALGESFRYSLGMPGHHGLEAMALLAAARLSTGYRWAATVAAMSAAGTAAAVGAGHGGLVPVLYLLPGLAIDAGVLLVPAWRRSILWLPVFAAIGHASKPLVKWVGTQGTSAHLGSMVNGLAYPVVTHLAFGFAGAFAAMLAYRAWQKRSN